MISANEEESNKIEKSSNERLQKFNLIATVPHYITYPAADTTTTVPTRNSSTMLQPTEISSVCKNVAPAAVVLNCLNPPNVANEIGASIVSAPMLDKIAALHASFRLNATTTTSTTIVTCVHCRHLATCDVQFREIFAKPTKFEIHRSRWPIFIVFISILEICIFVYDYITTMKKSAQNDDLGSGSSGGDVIGGGVSDGSINVADVDDTFYVDVPSDSVLIYRPDRREQVWRFVSYMLLHANSFHLGFNVCAQLLFGVALELMHGAMRVAIIYCAGVFAGSLGTSVMDSAAYLVGASGGVYALLTAQLANLCINYERLRYGLLHLIILIIFVFTDLIYFLYTKYYGATPFSISYIAHLSGSLAGFTLGFLILKNFVHKSPSNSHFIRWLAFIICLAFIGFAIVFNLINTVTAQSVQQQIETFRKVLLHVLGGGAS